MRSCLICEDHGLMRKALATSVAMHWPAAEITLAANFPEAWAAASAAPDFTLCDLGMPGAAPIEGIERLQAATPHTPIMVITANESDALLLKAFKLGIAGFIYKNSSGPVLEAAIRLVLAGGRYLPPRVIALTRDLDPGSDDREPSDVDRLTERQLEVLRQLAKGRSNKEIARALSISPATVKLHVAAILAALAVANRTEASFKGRMAGLL